MKFHNVWNSICSHYKLDPKRYKVEFQYESEEEHQERVDLALQIVLNGIVSGNVDVLKVSEDGLPDIRGRISQCRIYDGDLVIATGESHCCPSDNFVRVEGRRYAFNRAYEEFKVVRGLSSQTVRS